MDILFKHGPLNSIHVRAYTLVFPLTLFFKVYNFKRPDTPINKTDLSMAGDFLNHFSFSLKVQ